MEAIGRGIPYRGEMRRYVNKVVKRLKPKSIILYGSVATKSYGVGSDIDILVISDQLPKNFLERMKILYELNTANAPVDIVGYTTQEFQKMISKLHPTAISALTEGIPIHDNGYYKEAKRTLLRMKLKIVKTECGWETMEQGGHRIKI